MILCWPRPTWQKNQQIGDTYASVVIQPCHKHVIPHLPFNSVDHSLSEWWKGGDTRASATPSRRILYAHRMYISMKERLFQMVFLKNSSTSVTLEAVSKSDSISRDQAKTWRGWLLITNLVCQSKIRIRKQAVFWMKKTQKNYKTDLDGKTPTLLNFLHHICCCYSVHMETWETLFTSWPFSL